MIKAAIPLILISVLIVPLIALAQDDGCDLKALTADFLDHFSQGGSADERLNTMFEFLSFLMICKDTPECGNLNGRYAERIAEAETLDDLLIVNTELSADLILCQSGQGQIALDQLAAVFAELGADCSILTADPGYVYAECTGRPDQATAQALYAATLDYLGIESVFFSVSLKDSESSVEYTFTGDEWLVTQHSQ